MPKERREWNPVRTQSGEEQGVAVALPRYTLWRGSQKVLSILSNGEKPWSLWINSAGGQTSFENVALKIGCQ